MEKPKKIVPEVVGRKYQYVRYGMLTRRIGGNGIWYGNPRHVTEAGARLEFDLALRGSPRIENVGGIGVDFGPDNGERYERKLIKQTIDCEVLALGIGPA